MRIPATAVVLLAGAVPSQGFSANAVLATPLTVTASVTGSSPLVEMVPAGTPAGAVWLNPLLLHPNGSATGLFDGVFTVEETKVELRVIEGGGASPQAAMTLAPHDYVMTLQSPVLTPVEIRIEWSMQLSAGMTTPLAQVDLGDDGVIDFTGFANGQTMTVPIVVDASPFRVRTRTAWTAAPGNVQTELRCTVTPRFPVFPTTVVPGCFTSLGVFTTFDHELVLRGLPASPSIMPVMVLGSSQLAQPVPLPLSTNCVLGATPEIVVLPAVNGQLRLDLLTLPRPLTFYAQGVALLPSVPVVYATDTKRVFLP